jgi:hypothetical protein
MLHLLATLSAAMLIPAATEAGEADFPDDLEKWIAVEPPKAGSDPWFVANYDVKHEWVVSLRDGHPRAEIRNREEELPTPLPFELEKGTAEEGLAGRRFSTKVVDGYIVAFNAGEFGAGLWWFSPDGKKRDKIAEAWVKGYIPVDDGLLALEGLAHLGSSKGRIIRLVRTPEGRWRSEDLVDLKHAPEVALKRADGSLVVATTDRLLRVIPAEKKVEVLLENAFWRGLYPNSIATTADGTVYLGMRHGVARIERTDGSYKVAWLLPNQEFVDMKRPEGFK